MNNDLSSRRAKKIEGKNIIFLLQSLFSILVVSIVLIPLFVITVIEGDTNYFSAKEFLWYLPAVLMVMAFVISFAMTKDKRQFQSRTLPWLVGGLLLLFILLQIFYFSSTQ